MFAVAVFNGAAWSLLVPPFQVPDETAHFAYTQVLAETGHFPGAPDRPEFSTEQRRAMATLQTQAIIGRSGIRVPAEGARMTKELRQIAEEAPRGDGGGPSSASSQPPLFYAVMVLPYKLFAWATVPARLQAMRGVSVLLFASAAALAAMLAAEFVPGRAWASLVAGLAIALSPYTAFIATGVIPDSLLLAISTAVLLFTTRAFRHGWTAKRALALGALVGAGAVTKLIFLAFVPPAIFVAAFLTWRDRGALGGSPGRSSGVLASACIAAVAFPTLTWLWKQIVGGDNGARGTVDIATGAGGATNIREMLVYAWELFLPRLPFMSTQFNYSPPISTWVDGFAGRYGWLDYGAPASLVTAHRWFAAVVIVLVVVAFVVKRRTILDRRFEVIAYALFLTALGVVIAKAGYDYRRTTGFVFEQPRYLFGVLGVYAVAVAVACSVGGRRLAPVLAVIAISFFVVHNLSGLAQTVVRYYS